MKCLGSPTPLLDSPLGVAHESGSPCSVLAHLGYIFSDTEKQEGRQGGSDIPPSPQTLRIHVTRETDKQEIQSTVALL